MTPPSKRAYPSRSSPTDGPPFTDADAIQISRAGVPTTLVSVPLRYMHSAVETVCVDDIEATAQLIAAFARNLTPGISFAR